MKNVFGNADRFEWSYVAASYLDDGACVVIARDLADKQFDSGHKASFTFQRILFDPQPLPLILGPEHVALGLFELCDVRRVSGVRRDHQHSDAGHVFGRKLDDSEDAEDTRNGIPTYRRIVDHLSSRFHRPRPRS